MIMNYMNKQEAVGEAHSKLILAGEHAVVYNKPAIAIPFPLKIRAKIKEKPGEIAIISNIYTGNLYGMPDMAKGLLECIKTSFELCDKPMEGVQIEITSDIPIGRGLGSSAASAIAIIRGIFEYFKKPLTKDELYSLVEQAETYAHGNPSGIDMIAIASKEPILYQRQVGASSLMVSKPFYVVVADTGKVGDTRKAVDHVNNIKQLRPHVIDNIMNQIEDIVMNAKEAVLVGDSDLLGTLLSRNHELLKELGVSDPLLDHLVMSAIRSGALGAKLTGGGMGGCMIALAKDIRDARMISEALMREGAKMVWYFSTDSGDVNGCFLEGVIL